MLQRHKIPTIFNIYMLDVICCALGCVVLLWQVAHQEAEQQTADAKDAHAEAEKQTDAAIRARLQYEKAQQGLLSASNDVTQLQAEVTAWKQKHQGLTHELAAAQKDRENAKSALSLSTEQRKKLEADLAKLLDEQTKTSADLAGANKSNADLLAKIAATDKKAKEQAIALTISEENARKLQKLLDSIAVDSKDAQAKLKLADLELKMREQDLDRARKELAEMSASKEKLAKSLTGGAKDLTDAKGQVAALTIERDQLKDKLVNVNRKFDSLKAEAEQRFAGIPLTGESVVFLIDISGSMTMKDENTEDPDKWPFLCETLMQLMKSIPTMQRFQVILFSDKTRYLFGNRDSWLKYEGPATAKQTRDALRKVKVEGGTNMEEAFEEAFRLRKLKLDTIYLFSDGLPNIGSGVPADIRNPTEGQRNHFMGKFVRDKLKSDWNRPQEGMSDVRINAVGFFFESPDVGAFLWAMAREHRGAFVGLR
jgi:von Willebrand factor type A domain